jgi:hypothetical protein
MIAETEYPVLIEKTLPVCYLPFSSYFQNCLQLLAPACHLAAPKQAIIPQIGYIPNPSPKNHGLKSIMISPHILILPFLSRTVSRICISYARVSPQITSLHLIANHDLYIPEQIWLGSCAIAHGQESDPVIGVLP